MVSWASALGDCRQLVVHEMEVLEVGELGQRLGDRRCHRSFILSDILTAPVFRLRWVQNWQGLAYDG